MSQMLQKGRFRIRNGKNIREQNKVKRNLTSNWRRKRNPKRRIKLFEFSGYNPFKMKFHWPGDKRMQMYARRKRLKKWLPVTRFMDRYKDDLLALDMYSYKAVEDSFFGFYNDWPRSYFDTRWSIRYPEKEYALQIAELQQTITQFNNDISKFFLGGDKKFNALVESLGVDVIKERAQKTIKHWEFQIKVLEDKLKGST
jgi:hypothetical protein